VKISKGKGILNQVLVLGAGELVVIVVNMSDEKD
jgi:hypothetical protein